VNYNTVNYNNNSQNNNPNTEINTTTTGLTLEDENLRKQLNEKLAIVEDEILKQLNIRKNMGLLTEYEQEINKYLYGKEVKGKLDSQQDSKLKDLTSRTQESKLTADEITI